jgi:hypothetical protein
MRPLPARQKGDGVNLNLYGVLKQAIGIPDQAPPAPAMAQITIISTDPVKRSSENRSGQARD